MTTSFTSSNSNTTGTHTTTTWNVPGATTMSTADVEKARRLAGLKVTEVSGVDHPAHMEEGWLVLKSRSQPDMEAHVPQEINLEALDPEVQAHINDLYSTIDELTDTVEKALAAAESKPDPVADPVTDPVADTLEKALGDLPEPLRKAFEDNQRKAEEAEALAKSLMESSEIAEFTKAAGAYTDIPGLDPAKFGPVLRTVAKAVDTDTFSALTEVLKTAAATTANANQVLSDEIGYGGAGSTDAAESIEAIAKDISAKEGISYPEAVVKAASANPDLYVAHVNQIRKGA